MKQEINPTAAVVAVIILVLAVGWYLWKKTDAPGNDDGAMRAQFALTEKWAKEHHYDLRKDPLTAATYFKYHPDEKPTGGLPTPGPMGAPGAQGLPSPPGLPLMRSAPTGQPPK